MERNYAHQCDCLTGEESPLCNINIGYINKRCKTVWKKDKDKHLLDDILLIVDQMNCTIEQARDSLRDTDGDIVDAIMSFPM